MPSGVLLRIARRIVPPVALGLGLLVATSGAARAQETDHLACITVKDNSAAEGKIPVTISDILDDSFSNCRIKKVKLKRLCIRVAKNGGDDPRAGQSAAEAYGCYAIKCDEKPDGGVGVDDQFDSRVVQRKALKELCAPVELPPVIP